MEKAVTCSRVGTLRLSYVISENAAQIGFDVVRKHSDKEYRVAKRSVWAWL
jgi:hypothetical protein